MDRWSIILVFILLTQLDGTMISVDSAAIQAIRPSREGGQCHHGGGAAIRLSGSGLCVKETREQICAILDRVGDVKRCIE
jgi:hypothetical protein